MCGITGFFGNGDLGTLKAMTDAMVHRGPDGGGYFADPDLPVFLGHRRLSVLDISGGAQPMWNEDGQVGVVFNGEIYNYRELRSELIALGHRFRSDHSDTETLVHGYEEWGEELPDKLNGMFAFAILDRRQRRLFLARDRMGKKPLFYVDRPELFAFASELRPLLMHPATPWDSDVRALQKFMAHCFFPAPHTPYAHIRKLPAGHMMTFDLQERRAHLKEYWRFHITPAYESRSEEDLVEELRHLLDQAVQRRLESDVPLGTLLSGGVDSSGILALAQRHRGTAGMDTFSIGFAEPSFDESGFARQMAEHAGSRHHLEICDFSVARDEIPRLLGRLDEPIADSSILPTWLVCRFARQHVTVALTGDGADELFAGYDTFKALGASHLYSRFVPAPLHRVLRGAAGRLPASNSNMSFDFKIQRWLRGAGFPAKLWNPVWLAALEPTEISELFGTPVDPYDLYSEVLERWESTEGDVVDRSLEFFTAYYLQDGILTKADRASMLEGLELRSPFLDADVVAFASKLPNRFKFHRGGRKIILRKALRGLVPDSLLDRRKKGFGIPLTQWLREIPAPAEDKVPGMDHGWLRKRWDMHRQGIRDCRHGLWCWLALHHHYESVAQLRA